MSEYRQMMDWFNRPPERVKEDAKRLATIEGLCRLLLSLEDEAFMAGLREYMKDPGFRAELRRRLGPIDFKVRPAIAKLEEVLRLVGKPRTFRRAAANLEEILGEIQ
jgi:hypothetical protein